MVIHAVAAHDSSFSSASASANSSSAILYPAANSISSVKILSSLTIPVVWLPIEGDGGRLTRSDHLFANLFIPLFLDTNRLRLAIPFDYDFHKDSSCCPH